jgi:hypothetical protein
MDQNLQNYISINNVLADILVILDDESQSKLTPGFYIAAVKNCLDDLGFESPFHEVVTDTLMPADLILDMPVGCYNLKQINIFTGTPDDIQYSENVYWKKRAKTQGKDTGFTSDVHHYNVSDPFFRVAINEYSLYYFSIQNGQMYLSDACQYFEYVRTVYDGMASKNLTTVAMIPPEVRKAVVLWVTEKCAGALKMRDNRYRTIQIDSAAQLDEYGLNGAWHQAKTRITRLDSKKLRDAILYRMKMNY